MDDVANTSLICGEPQTLILIGSLLKEVMERIADAKKLVVEGISYNRHFGGKSGKAQTIRDMHRFLAVYEITAPRKGQVPDLSTQMQEKRNAKSSQKAPVSESLSSAPDRQALPATGTWPTWIKCYNYANVDLRQEVEIKGVMPLGTNLSKGSDS